MTSPFPVSANIAGSVLPIRRAEELIATLPGVLSVRIVPNETGEVDEVHVLTTDQVAPKHTVRNIESALMAQLGLRVNHRKISIATTLDAPRAVDQTPAGGVAMPSAPGLQAVPGGLASPTPAMAAPSVVPTPAIPNAATSTPGGYTPPPMPVMPMGTPAGVPWPPRPVMPPGYGVGGVPPMMVPMMASPGSSPVWGQPMAWPDGVGAQGGAPVVGAPVVSAPISGSPAASMPQGGAQGPVASASSPMPGAESAAARRLLLFEDVEVRRSRVHGVSCRVTLSRDGQAFHGEADGQDTERSRIDLAARATLQAIAVATQRAPGAERGLALEGAKGMEAFDRHFVFVSVLARAGRESVVLTGSCEVRESAETSAVLAVLDATNRWIQFDR